MQLALQPTSPPANLAAFGFPSSNTPRRCQATTQLFDWMLLSRGSVKGVTNIEYLHVLPASPASEEGSSTEPITRDFSGADWLLFASMTLPTYGTITVRASLGSAMERHKTYHISDMRFLDFQGQPLRVELVQVPEVKLEKLG